MHFMANKYAVVPSEKENSMTYECFKCFKKLIRINTMTKHILQHICPQTEYIFLR